MVRTISPKYGRARATRLIPPPEGAGGPRSSAPGSDSWSGLRLGHRFVSERLHGGPLGQVVTALDDHRLALFQVGARDGHPALVRRPDLGVEHDRLPIPDDVQDRTLAQVEDRDGRDLEGFLAFIHDDRHPDRLPES